MPSLTNTNAAATTTDATNNTKRKSCAAAAPSPTTTTTTMTKFNAASKLTNRPGPSAVRQWLPIALCLFTFATILSLLIFYIDTTEIRHQQFRLNMSRDYDLRSISQDNPVLITYLREVHMRKYSHMPFFTHHHHQQQQDHEEEEEHQQVATKEGDHSHNDLTATMGRYVATVLNGGASGSGVYIQSLFGAADALMTGPWLSETRNWTGVIVEPDPRKYFTYRKQNARRPNVEVIHACFSPNKYPKEITLHEDEDEVRIDSVLDGDTDWFQSRVKCFPLYTIMLAINRTTFDLLSLGCHGLELQILQTLPFEEVSIGMISLHFVHEQDKDYMNTLSRFLAQKGYAFANKMQNNYFYQKKRAASRMKQQQEEKQQIKVVEDNEVDKQ